MKIVSNHSSARPHRIKSTNNHTISDVLKQHAQSVINDKSIDAETTELLRHADANETIDNVEVTGTREKIEALVEIICGGGSKSPAALLVLMATLENASEPEVLAHAAKHFAFTRCGELNVCGMVEAQTALLESELFAAG